MNVLFFEVNKSFVKQKCLIWFVVCLLVTTAISIFVTCNFSTEMSSLTRKIYDEYQIILSGKLDTQKEKFIESEHVAINDAVKKKQQLDDDLMSGKVESDFDYVDRFRNIEMTLNKSVAFELILKQYYFVQEHPGDRYFIGLSPYAQLFTSFGTEYIAAGFIILLATLLFCKENSSNMIFLLRTAKYGREQTALCKFVIMLFTCVVVVVLICTIKLVAFNALFGMDEVGYPIQSLEFFSGCSYNLTIWQGLMVCFALRVIGFCSFGALVITITLFSKNAVIPIFAPLAALFVLHFSFATSEIAYLLPFSIGLMYGNGYLRGDTYEVLNRGFVNEKTIKVFGDIPAPYLAIICIINLINIAVSCLLTIHRYGNRHKPLRMTWRHFVLLLLPFFLSGCNSFTENPKIHTQNIKENFYFAQNDTMIFENADNVYMTNKMSNIREKIIRDPFSTSNPNEFNKMLYAYGDNLFIMKADALDVTISEVSTINFSVREIFKTHNAPHQSFLNAMIISNRTASNPLEGVHSFFLDNKNIFFINSENQVIKVSRLTKQVKVIIDEAVYSSLAFDGKTIYYINRRLQLKAYDLVSGVTTQLTNQLCDSMHLSGNRIFMQMYRTGERFIHIRLHRKNQKS